MIAFADLCVCSQVLREAVAGALRRGERPLVLGGDCTLLLGAVCGVRDAVGRVALWFVDGHADYLDGRSSPTGEAADIGVDVEQRKVLAGEVAGVMFTQIRSTRPTSA